MENVDIDSAAELPTEIDGLKTRVYARHHTSVSVGVPDCAKSQCTEAYNVLNKWIHLRRRFLMSVQ